MKTIRLLTILMILSLASLEAAKGQQLFQKTEISLYSTSGIHMSNQKAFAAIISSDQRITRPAFVHLSLSKWHSGNSAAMAPTPVAPDYYYNHCYGIFCKMEWIAQNQWHIPVTLRLGTYHYERSLEGEE